MRFYDSIENIPIGIFNKIMSTNDLLLLQLKGLKDEKKCYSCWCDIMNEYFLKFGVPKDYDLYIKKRMMAVKKYAQAIKTNNRTFVTLAKVLEKEAIDDFSMSVGEGEQFNITLARVSKFMGFVIDPNKTTVVDFYSYVKIMQDGK